jgi:hypothetical protein
MWARARPSNGARIAQMSSRRRSGNKASCLRVSMIYLSVITHRPIQQESLSWSSIPGQSTPCGERLCRTRWWVEELSP